MEWISRVLQPVFTSRKISKGLKITETKLSLVNQQSVVYESKCNSCDANFKGYKNRHLHLRIEEHKYSVIGKHLKDEHNQRPNNLHEQFAILKKCRGKFECLIWWDVFNKEKETDSEQSKTPFQRNCLFNCVHSFVSLHLIFILIKFHTFLPL